MTNTIYIENLHVLSVLCKQVGDSVGAAEYLARAKKARASLDELCWNEADGLYYGVNGKENKPLNVNTFMSLMPLLLSDLDKDKVDLLIARVLNPDEYWAEYPIPSVAMNHPTYRPDTVGGNLVWRGPSWMNSNWYIARGLKRHGRLDLARHIANQSIAMVKKSGFREYYNPQNAFGRGAPDFSWSTILIDLLDEVK
jgi:glycogen debranching enzyme